MTDEANEATDNRLAALSAALSEWHHLGWKRRNRATWFAEALAKNLTDYVGVPVGRDLAGAGAGIEPIRFYSFKAGQSPEYDNFKLKDSAFDAIGIDTAGYRTLGIGIQLELQPKALPRYHFTGSSSENRRRAMDLSGWCGRPTIYTDCSARTS